MHNALEVLLVSESKWLEKLVREVCQSIGLQAKLVGELPSLHENPTHVAMTIVHAVGSLDPEEIKQTIVGGTKCSTAIPVLVVTEQSCPEEMIDYLRVGAADCVSSPIESERLSFLVDSLTVERRLSWQRLTQPVHNHDWVSLNGSEPVCASSHKLASVVQQIKKVAPQNTNILMTGETGAGKTRLSRMIHEISPRRDQPFVVVNCAAMPTQLLESELFGHRKGAFTGADKNQEGKFSFVKGGTLLLDEVDTLSLEAQAKLLRTVESRIFEPIGSNESQQFQGRLIVATNQDLSVLVQQGKFRSDLYYRLNVVDLQVPPLRERPEEILQIAEACIEEFAASNQTVARKISPEVKDVLLSHSWPGNIRELRNAMEQAMTFSSGEFIRLGDLPKTVLGIQRADSFHEEQAVPVKLSITKDLRGVGVTSKAAAVQGGQDSRETSPASLHRAGVSNIAHKAPGRISEMKLSSGREVSMMGRASSLRSARAIGEKQILVEVLKSCRNNRSEAAKTLGISRTALYKKLNKYDLIHAALA